MFRFTYKNIYDIIINMRRERARDMNCSIIAERKRGRNFPFTCLPIRQPGKSAEMFNIDQ